MNDIYIYREREREREKKKRERERERERALSLSLSTLYYTNLTHPTNRDVYISVVAISIKKKGHKVPF